MRLAVDTSVVVKWFVEEDGSDRAVEYFREDLFAPDLLSAELASALWKKVRLAEITAKHAEDSFSRLASFVTLIASVDLGEQALSIALELNHPVYDCFFLAFAETGAFEIVTADKKLIRRCEGTRFEPLLLRL